MILLVQVVAISTLDRCPEFPYGNKTVSRVQTPFPSEHRHLLKNQKEIRVRKKFIHASFLMSLTACSTSPSESDMNAAIQRHLTALLATLRNRT
jgi:hypothetical protein